MSFHTIAPVFFQVLSLLRDQHIASTPTLFWVRRVHRQRQVYGPGSESILIYLKLPNKQTGASWSPLQRPPSPFVATPSSIARVLWNGNESSAQWLINLVQPKISEILRAPHGFEWFAVMVFTLSRLKMDGSGETRFGAVRFMVPGQVCGLVTVRFTIPGQACGSVSVRFALNNIFLPGLRHLRCLPL